jgi:hypothetical protein
VEIRKNKRGNTKVKLTPGEERAMYKEIEDQLLEFVCDNLLEIEAMMLMQLREQLGFGKKRLTRFYDNFDPTIYDLMVRKIKYENGEKPQPSIERLKAIGVDIDQLALIREKRNLEAKENEQ